jgi:hypothetical protein
LLRDRGQFATLTIRPLGEPIPPSQGESPFPLDFYLSWMSPKLPPEAQDWSNRLQRPMHSASIETDRFCISLVFSETRHRKVSDGVGIVRQVLIPLDTPGKLQ